MNGSYQQGRSFLATLLTWMLVLTIGSIVARILMAEFVRWVTILAPWVLLLLVIGGVTFVVAALVRRRSYGY